jgi:hypothetical protein
MNSEIERIKKVVEIALCTVVFPTISYNAMRSLLADGYRIKPDSTVFIGGVKISKPKRP